MEILAASVIVKTVKLNLNVLFSKVLSKTCIVIIKKLEIRFRGKVCWISKKHNSRLKR